MNNEKKDILGAIGGNAEGTNGGEPDYKALYEKSQKELQANKVEDGRLRKVNEELAAARKELDELRRSKRTEEAINALPEDLKNEVPDDIKRGSAVIAQKAVDSALSGAMADTNERLARLEREQEEARVSADRVRKAEFERRIANTYPDFLKGIDAGGDKREAWMKYRRFNEASIQSAISSCDYDTLEYHIKNFYREIDVPLPTAGQGYTAPEPRPASGGQQVIPQGGGKTYTLDEYVALQEKCEKLFYENKAEYAKLRDELEKAMAEGRVKRQ